MRCFILAAVALAASSVSAGDLTVEKTFASPADFEAFARDPGIDLASSPGAITLSAATPKGTIVSPPIDMASPTNGDAISPLFKIRSLDIQWRAIVPGAASVKIEARAGPSAWPDDSWSPWTSPDRVLPARFAQVRAALSAGGDGVAPSLTRLTLTARGECVATPEDQGYALREFRNFPCPPPVSTNAASTPDAEPAGAPRLFLTCTETPGELAVSAHAIAPSLKTFRFAASSQPPALIPGERTDSVSCRARFRWKLTPGINTLSVTAIDASDHESAAAAVSVDWKPPTPTPNLEQP